jgi:hypothetical protein
MDCAEIERGAVLIPIPLILLAKANSVVLERTQEIIHCYYYFNGAWTTLYCTRNKMYSIREPPFIAQIYFASLQKIFYPLMILEDKFALLILQGRGNSLGYTNNLSNIQAPSLTW